jgi:nucleotide-binding universal stress UspA family protein
MLSRILVPLDGSLTAAAIIPRLRRRLRGGRAVIHLLAVRPTPRVPASPDGGLRHPDELLLEGLVPRAARKPGSVFAERRYVDDVIAQEQAYWEHYLHREGNQLTQVGLEVRQEVRFGDPLAETLATAERYDLPVVAVVARPQRWWQRLLRPSLAQRLLEQPSVSVLIA